MKNYVNGHGFEFDGKFDCNGKLGLAGNFKVNYKGDCFTTHILWCVDSDAKLIAPAYNDIAKGFLPISSGLIESEETFEDDMLRFIKSNKPYYVVPVDEMACIICDIKVTFDEKGNITDDSDFNMFLFRERVPVEQADGSRSAKIYCSKAIAGNANETFHLEQYNETILETYKSRIKAQLTKDNCKDRLSFLSYLVQDRDSL